MNKQELIARNSGVKLYDLSGPSDMHRMNVNLAYCSKKSKEPSFKLIAPFGHPLKFKADYYYFESENTPISEQILQEMGFEHVSSVIFENEPEYEKIICKIKIECFFVNNKAYLLINSFGSNLNANQLFTLIQLLS